MKREKFQNQISWYNFILCVLVVLIHSQNTDFFTSGSSEAVSINNQLQQMITSKVAVVGVAGFFLCSGYLFYRNYSWEKVIEKYRTRFKGLFLPYVIWAFIYYMLHVIVSYIPTLRLFLDKAEITVNWSEIIDAIVNYKYCAFLWFLQFLILYVLLSPVIYTFIKNKYVGLISIILILMVDASRIPGELMIGNVQIQAFLNWLFIYMTGGYIGIHGKREAEGENISWKLLAVSGTLCIGAYYFWNYVPNMLSNLTYLLLFAITLWYLLGRLPLPKIREWQKHTFMVYMTHFLFVRAANMFVSKYISNSAYFGMLLFLLLPLASFMIVSLLWYLLGKGKCFLWKILTGYR